MNKIVQSFEEAIADVFDGTTIAFGGFIGKPGSPTYLILALRDQGAKNLTVVSNRVAAMDLDPLFAARQVRKAIASAPVPGSRAPSPFEEQYLAGEVELEIVPQGTLVERLRAGASGLGGFYTPVGVGTLVAEGKEVKVINGREYILELPLVPDYAFIRAYKADKIGNLTYWRAQRNFNPVMAASARFTIAEVDEIVEVGELDPEAIVTPSIYVHRVVKRQEGKK
ncbi:CoA transferase subunit A [Chloroflexota bacterium]